MVIAGKARKFGACDHIMTEKIIKKCGLFNDYEIKGIFYTGE